MKCVKQFVAAFMLAITASLNAVAAEKPIYDDAVKH